MARRDIVVIGASAGGVEPLRTVVAGLRKDLPAAVLVVLHMSPSVRTRLPEILARTGALPAVQAVHAAPIHSGAIYVAGPGRHLLVHGDRIRVANGPRENGHRPAVDPLFRSAARWYGPRVIAVVLSGALDDGTTGAFAVRLAGGVVIAQTPEDALHPSMPANVVEAGLADHVVPVAGIAPLIQRLVHEEVPNVERPRAVSSMAPESLERDDAMEDPESPPAAPASSFTCPECHGALWELKDGGLVRYRCRVGHAFAPESFMAYQTSHVEEALWTALRALEESAALAKRLADRSRAQGLAASARRYDEKERDAEERAEVIRGVLDPRGSGDVARREG